MKSPKIYPIDEAVDLLDEWSEIEGTEVGDFWSNLTSLWHNHELEMSQSYSGLLEELEKAIIAEAQFAKKSYEVVKDTTTITRYILKMKDFRCKSDCLE